MADFDEDSSYLQPGFDPNTLTMPRLRNILFQHDISYPSGAKKAQLVDVFESQLRPKAKRILAQRARVKRTSMGIQDMASQESIEDDDEAAEQMPVRRTTRKSSAAPSAASTTRSRTSRKSTRTPATDAGHTEDEEETASRRSRYSTATPNPESASESGRSKSGRRKTRLSDFDPPTPTIVKEETFADNDDGISTPKGPSPFSMENPFQSGSSPLEEMATGPARKIAAKKGAKRRPTSSNSYIKSEEDDEPVAIGRKSKGAGTKLSNGAAKSSRSRTVSVEPGEEFTKEEQEELEEEEAATGQEVMPARKRNSGSGAKTGPLVVLTTILAGVGAWWRQEKITAGYCGAGSSGQVISLSNSDVQLPEFLSVLQPQCEPCPQHAFCYSDFEARCEPDFVLQNHPLSFGGLIPIAPSCEPDSEKARKVKAVADRAVEELREQKAKYECGGTDKDGQTVSSPGLSEETLKAKVSARRRRGMTEFEFEELWKGAIGDVFEREEVTKDSDRSHRRGSSDTDNAGVVLSSSSLARLPFGCAIRRSARLSVARYRVPLALVMLLSGGLLYLRRKLLASQTDKARVPGLVATALDRLATQAALAEQGRVGEPYISMGGLRDDVLRDEFSAQRRDRIWNRVKAVVELNANVRAGVREDRSGNVSRVWEWIGPLPQIDDGGYSSGYDSRRQSGRFSLGGGGGGGGGSAGRRDSSNSFLGSYRNNNSSSPMPASRTTQVKTEDEGSRLGSPAVGNVGVSADVRRWDEGRPVY